MGGPRSSKREIFREWLARTGDPNVAAERAGVSTRTARRWREDEGAVRTDLPQPIVGAPPALLGQPTRFFGHRDAELRRLVHEGARLVTVLGPAGIGKTRLVLRYAELERAAYDAVFFCDLSDARTEDGVTAVVARVVGAARSDPRAVAYALEARGRVLLLLDNFEGAVAAAPATAGLWSALPRRVHVVVTSRVQLRVAGEACLVLEPLAVPSVDATDPSTADAVQLLVDRARLVRGDFVLAPEDAGFAGEIVRHLDGNALAIELAAARLAILSPKQLLARLASRFELLVGGARDAAARQASMRVALDGSWELLDEPTRGVFAELSVFVAPFPLDAAEAVSGSALDALERLRQASLVVAGSSPAGDVRFRFYETIREYASLRAEELGRDALARDRHRDHFAERARTWSSALSVGGVGAPSARRELELAQPDLAAALRHALASGDRPKAFALAIGVGASRFAHPATEVAIYDDVLRAFPEHDRARLELLAARGEAHRRAGDLVASARDFGSVAAEASADAGLAARAALGLGNAAHAGGKTEDALAQFARALEGARAADDPLLQGRVLARIATSHRLRQDTERALSAALEARSLFERHGGPRELADVLGTLGTLHQRRGELARARACYEEALPLVDVSDPNVAGPFYGNLGTLENQLGDLTAARASFERALEIFARAGIRRLEGVSLGNLASIDFETGALEEARRKLERTLRMLEQVGDASHSTFFGGQLGAVLATLGHPADAESLLAVAESSAERATWAPALALHRGFLELARAAVAETAEAAALRASVRARIDAAPKQAVDDVAVLVRMLERALERPHVARAAVPIAGTLTVDRDASNVWLPSAAKLSLANRRAVRLILLCLVERHQSAEAATPLTVDELFAAGWPGERALRDAITGRVYVALATLRRLGLRELLVHRDGGYLLDPELRVVRA